MNATWDNPGKPGAVGNPEEKKEYSWFKYFFVAGSHFFTSSYFSQNLCSHGSSHSFHGSHDTHGSFLQLHWFLCYIWFSKLVWFLRYPCTVPLDVVVLFTVILLPLARLGLLLYTIFHNYLLWSFDLNISLVLLVIMVTLSFGILLVQKQQCNQTMQRYQTRITSGSLKSQQI